MLDSATHVTLDAAGVIRTLVLQHPGEADVDLTLRGTAPDTLRYRGQMWSATHTRLHRAMAPNGYRYVHSG